jgi:hypothetical protein
LRQRGQSTHRQAWQASLQPIGWPHQTLAARIDVQPDEGHAFQPGRLAVDDDERRQHGRQRQRRHQQRRDDEGQRRAAEDEADQHQDRAQRQGNLQARVEDDADRQVALVGQHRLDADDVLDGVAGDRDDDQARRTPPTCRASSSPA